MTAKKQTKGQAKGQTKVREKKTTRKPSRKPAMAEPATGPMVWYAAKVTRPKCDQCGDNCWRARSTQTVEVNGKDQTRQYVICASCNRHAVFVK